MSHLSRAVQGLVLGVFGLLLVGLIVPARAQEGPDKYTTKDLEDEVTKKENRDLISKLLRGEVPGDPGNPEHVKALEAEARYVLFRFHDIEYHDQAVKDDRKTIARLIRDFESDFNSLVKTPARTAAVWPIYTRAMTTQGKAALQSRFAIARINVARCLARLAELEQPDLAEFYAGVLFDETQLDAVKYYALRGLTDLLGNEKVQAAMKKETLDKAARATMVVAQRSAKFLPGTPDTEIEGFRVLRREALRALAAARLPSLSDKSQPAALLAKTLAGTGVNPKVKMDERVEAAIGLGKMRPDADPDYAPDYAAGQVGTFVSEFRTFALDRDGGNKIAKLPCKVYAARLQDALDRLDKACEKQPKAVKEYVTAVSKAAYPVLGLLQKDNPSVPQVDNFARELDRTVGTGGPNKQLFKGRPRSNAFPGSPPRQRGKEPPSLTRRASRMIPPSLTRRASRPALIVDQQHGSTAPPHSPAVPWSARRRRSR